MTGFVSPFVTLSDEPDMYMHDRDAIKLRGENMSIQTPNRFDGVDELLRSSDPMNVRKIDEDRLLNVGIAAERRHSQARAARISKPAWIALGSVALLGLGFTGPAIADVVQRLAQTGTFGPVTSETDGSEWIDTSGSDFSQYAISLLPSWLTLPGEYSKTQFASAVVAQIEAGGGASQETSIKHSFEHNARCMWIDEWLLADAVGDSARSVSASGVLVESVNWPASVAVAGGGYLDHLSDVASASTFGDREVLVAEQQADCGSIPEELRR